MRVEFVSGAKKRREKAFGSLRNGGGWEKLNGGS